MDRKKELKEMYKNMKPDMGIFMIKANFSNQCFVDVTQDVKSTINSVKFRLNFGNFPNKELQTDWTEHGEENFTIEFLEKLPYDKDESKTDYREELAILKMMWEEKLTLQGLTFYQK